MGDDARPPPGPGVTFATTEHFNLQTARALTVSEANGRASIYLAALSTNLIALAFIGQMSRLGVAFYAFALILLPVLAFVGAVTFLRLVQSSVEDMAFAHRIALLRSYYLDVAPELEPYLVVVRRPPAAVSPDESPSAWQLTLTAAGMVAVVNSVVLGACAGLVVVAACGDRRLRGARTPSPARSRRLRPGGHRPGRDPRRASLERRRCRAR
jgi:hypothetical protein